MIKSTNYWWNNIDKLSEPLEPLTKELFEEFLKEYSKTLPEYFYLIEKKKEKKVKGNQGKRGGDEQNKSI